MEAVQNRFTDELLKEIVPFVEKHYRVQTGPEHRAIAGLSMGGGQTLRVVSSHPDQFAYVGSGAPGLRRQRRQLREADESFLNDADQFNRIVKLFSISVGDKDFLARGLEEPGGAAGEARHQARAARQRRRTHLDQLATLPERVVPNCSGEVAALPFPRRAGMRKKANSRGRASRRVRIPRGSAGVSPGKDRTPGQ